MQSKVEVSRCIDDCIDKNERIQAQFALRLRFSLIFDKQALDQGLKPFRARRTDGLQHLIVAIPFLQQTKASQ